jgi:hypothetical protein
MEDISLSPIQNEAPCTIQGLKLGYKTTNLQIQALTLESQASKMKTSLRYQCYFHQSNKSGITTTEVKPKMENKKSILRNS